MPLSHQGSCLCGSVQFAIDGELERFFLCHCQRCRKGTGTVHAANIFSTNAALTWQQGAELVQIFQLPDTQHARSFCQCCGSALPMTDGSLVMVPAGSLDSEVTLAPDAHICMKDRADWEDQLANTPRLDGLPG